MLGILDQQGTLTLAQGVPEFPREPPGPPQLPILLHSISLWFLSPGRHAGALLLQAPAGTLSSDLLGLLPMSSGEGSGERQVSYGRAGTPRISSVPPSVWTTSLLLSPVSSDFPLSHYLQVLQSRQTQVLLNLRYKRNRTGTLHWSSETGPGQVAAYLWQGPGTRGGIGIGWWDGAVSRKV